MRQVKVDSKLKRRIEKGYRAIAESRSKDTTEYEKQLLGLEKRLVESALEITLTNEEVEDLKVIVNVKAVFPNSKVVGVSDKRARRKNDEKGGEEEMSLIAKAPERRLCPAGIHRAKVERVEPKHHEQWGERVLFTFPLDGKFYEDGVPIKVFTECSNTLSPKGKLRKVVEAVLGRELTREEAQGFDLETLVGKECQVVVKHEKGSDGNVWARVETVIPV